MKSALYFQNSFPKPVELAEFPILIYDKNLLKNKATKSWIASFDHSLGVKAGENLKQFKQFEKYFVDILKLVEKTKTKNITLIGLGGGSVGDFVGFMASVFKRGVPLIHIPSTWLAAIDSSHGGKTALNVAGYKNQIGTFYPASKIYLIKDLLATQPEARVTEALGEVLKTVLLSGGSLWKKTHLLTAFDKGTLWNILPELIAYKYKIVKKDPFEQKGIRFYLNFGHTYGHVLESVHQLPHGIAVNYGLRLAIEFSRDLGILSDKVYSKIESSPLMSKNLISKKTAVNLIKKTPQLEKQLLQDKKAGNKNSIKYVFIKNLGAPKVQTIKTSDLVDFTKKLKLIKD